MINQKSIVNFYYRLFPRTLKESVKNILFSGLPFLFKRWEVYQNWKYGRIFQPKGLKIRQKEYWQRKLCKTYTIKLELAPEPVRKTENQQKLAVVIHVFYPEIFKEIMDLLRQHKAIDFSLYLTGTKQVLSEIKPLYESTDFSSVTTLETANRGRDILPFLKILPKVFEDGHNTILKLHTKGSNHLNRKEHWRNQLFSKLIGKGSVEHALQIFRSNPAIGMMGPAGNILPMSLYYAANGRRVADLCYRMGLKKEQLSDLNFVAGSMFYARREALLPIVNFQLSETDFEPEAAQTDGTMAHALERAFAGGLIVSGLQLADTDYLTENPVLRVSKTNKHII